VFPELMLETASWENNDGYLMCTTDSGFASAVLESTARRNLPWIFFVITAADQVKVMK
jgi:hypothetical protein